MRAFREILAKSKNVVVLTGSGVSAESGVPTFRYTVKPLQSVNTGPENLWRKRCVTELATPETFRNDPSLVWEFYSHRRELANSKVPNAAHKTIANLEAQFRGDHRNLTIITQNTDMLHHRAGSRNVLEMFGNLFTTRCTDCGHISNNHDIPIVSSLKGRGDPDAQNETPISVDLLPRCEKCRGLLRPHVVWYGEGMDYSLLSKVDQALRNCDLYIVVGSSSQIYPAANYGPFLAARGIPVAEFNRDEMQVTDGVHFHFGGNCRDTLPQALLDLTLN